MIKAVIFDMDGVIIDSEPGNLQELSDFYASYGVHVRELFLNSLVGCSWPFTYEESIRILGKDWSMEQFDEIYVKFSSQRTHDMKAILNKGMLTILPWLQDNGYKIGIASSSKMEHIERMVTVCEIKQYFSSILSGEMFKESKPNPEIYLVSAKNLGCEPHECFVIEDSSFGIEAGKRAGMHVLAYRDERYGVDQGKANAIIDSLEDIKDHLKRS